MSTCKPDRCWGVAGVVRVARACYACASCGKDVSLDAVLAWDATDGKFPKVVSRSSPEVKDPPLGNSPKKNS